MIVIDAARNCVFCGEPPGALGGRKSNEHIVPKWLIELTGPKNRNWHLGLKYDDPGLSVRIFSASSFQFPACSSCNNSLSIFENSCKSTIESIISMRPILASELNMLLDWFDKVRVGLFLGAKYLNRKMPQSAPSFYINGRVGKTDRCLLVFKTGNGSKSLKMFGALDLFSMFNPVAFMLKINDFTFVNISKPNLVSRCIGFPGYEKITIVEAGSRETGGLSRTILEGLSASYELREPQIGKRFPVAALSVYQSIADPTLLPVPHRNMLEHPYIRRQTIPRNHLNTIVHSAQRNEMRSNVVVKKSGNLAFYDAESHINFDAEISHCPMRVVDLSNIARHFFRYRHDLINSELSVLYKNVHLLNAIRAENLRLLNAALEL